MEVMPDGTFFVSGRNGFRSRTFATAALAGLYEQQMHDGVRRVWAGNPIGQHAWGNLCAVVLSGRPVKKPEHKQAILEAQAYMEQMWSLDAALDRWRECVTGGVDDALARTRLFDLLESIEKGRQSLWAVEHENELEGAGTAAERTGGT